MKYKRLILAVCGLLLGSLAGLTYGQEKECLRDLRKTKGELVHIQAQLDGVYKNADQPGICQDSVLQVRDDEQGQHLVYLAPSEYLGASEDVFTSGQELDIWGTWHETEGERIFVAHTVIKPSGLALSLRTHEDGLALWLVGEGVENVAMKHQASQEASPTHGTIQQQQQQQQKQKNGNSEQANKTADHREVVPTEKEATQATAGQLAATKKTQKREERKISLLAGHNVVDAVDDVRETTGDLVGAMLQAVAGIGFREATKAKENLQAMLNELNLMEQRLDRKAEKSDSSWLNWLEDRDYSVTVKSEIAALADMYSRMGVMLAEAKATPGLQIIVGHNLVDQVDDSRETVADLINAINDAGPRWGWFDENTLFTDHMTKLQQMEGVLDAKAERTDAEWKTFFGDPQFTVTIRDQVISLGSTLVDIANRIKLPAAASS